MNIRHGIFCIITASLSGMALLAVAQDEKDALRYSMTSTYGTARGMGIGGALGSVGGDFSTLSVNPAGIGIYRSSEFMFTPSLKLSKNNSFYTGNNTSDDATRFNFNNIGIILTSSPNGKRYERSKWKSVSFGLGINRQADFTNRYTYSGVNTTSSGTEIFLADALRNPGNIEIAGTLANIGYGAYLIDLDTIGPYLVAPFGIPYNQKRTVKERGGLNDIAISLGGNYMEKLMLGATLGLPSIRFFRESTFEESDATNNPNNFYDNFVIKESLTTRGFGVNLKLGFIYKATESFRFGAAVHTPTYFGMTDAQSTAVSSNTEGFKLAIKEDNTNPVTALQASTDIPDNVFEYSMTTPFKGVLSATGILNNFGFLTADYEYVSYNSARINYGSGYEDLTSTINNIIRNTYRGASNVRLGAEGRFDMVMVRLGFGYYGNPYKTGGSDRMDYTGGIGFRFSDWYADLGFVHSQLPDVQEQPYKLVYPSPTGEIAVPKAQLKNSLNNVAITIGFKF